MCSRYWRTAADISALGLQLCLRVSARRFRCEDRECSQRIFAERPPWIPAWGRRSDRITTLLAYTALGVGGLPVHRVPRLYGLDYSHNTLLRAARQMVTDGPKSVAILGVDDYAYRRGVSYGTLLYDLAERKVVDLLPERSAEFLAAWLRAHPGVKVISRDRGGIYAQGAKEGAPQAVQVADRFHLMQNLGDCLEKIAQKGIRLTEGPPAAEDLPQASPPEPAPPAPWEGGGYNGCQLYQEIRAQGYAGSESTLRHYLRSWRTALPLASGATLSRHSRLKTPQTKEISPRAFRRLVLKSLRTAEEECLLARIAASDPRLATSTSLAHAFAAAIRAHDAAGFDCWLDQATAAGIPEWKTFAKSLRRDIEAVHNGITLPWSQGPIEASIHHLKLIKRTMYGRSGHDLLCRRVIFHLPD